jgi:3-oxoacyl-[acyl-carrier protein] reductase
MLEERVAIVTGAGRGIGRATATLLAGLGARVVVADVDESAAQASAAELGTAAVSVAGVITDPEVPAGIVEAAVDTWGRLDIVVNNAGYTLDGPIHTMDDDAYEAMLAVHAVAPFRLLRAAAPHLREPAKLERAEGREVFRKVVNVSSVSATMGNATQVNYAAGKAALLGLTRSLAKEWGPFRVNVNAVALGFIDTRLTQARTESSVARVGEREVPLGVPEQVRAMMEMFAPLGRAGSPHEAAGPIAFLCSPWSDYVTGQVLTVSGGLPLGMS